MIPRPVRYRAIRTTFDGRSKVVEFQQSEGDRWFLLAEVEEDLGFDWGPGEHGHIEKVRHLASALLLSRVSLGEAGELVDDMADLILRMPVEGWEMDGKTMGTVVARLCLGLDVTDPAFPLDLQEQKLASLFGGRPQMKYFNECDCGAALPHHLAECGLTAHVCRCHRRYRVEAGAFIPDGFERNPFVEVPRG